MNTEITIELPESDKEIISTIIGQSDDWFENEGWETELEDYSLDFNDLNRNWSYNSEHFEIEDKSYMMTTELVSDGWYNQVILFEVDGDFLKEICYSEPEYENMTGESFFTIDSALNPSEKISITLNCI